jgi:UDP-N-acetylmuramoyl-tripeptide--D-alanyl-D-alanine ligase
VLLAVIKEAAEAAGGRLYGDPDKVITGVFTDSRQAFENGLFAAIPGEKTDGHIFVGELAAKGYLCLVSDEKYFVPSTILVKNTKQAVYDIAMYYRNEKISGTKVIAVTGSVGKTTVKDMTGLVLSSGYKTFATKGNSNSLLGVPVSVMSVEADDEYAVLELGMSSRGEIEKLSKLVKPFLSVITMIGSSHLEALGSRENIRKEKFDILAGEKKGNAVLLDGDSEYEYSLKNNLEYRPVYCGTVNPECDFKAENIVFTDGMTVFDAVWEGGRQRMTLPTEGLHNVKNSLYAFAAGVMNGVPPEKASSALARFAPTGDRQRIYNKNGVTIIADCYNASPESMKASLGVLASKNGRKIAVLGDMLELGVDEKRFHTENARFASEAADILIFVGNFSALCKEAAGAKEAYSFAMDEKKQVTVLLKSILKPGDIVLFKGSRRIRLDDIIKEADL